MDFEEGWPSPVEGAALEKRFSGNRDVSSNLTPSVLLRQDASTSLKLNT